MDTATETENSDYGKAEQDKTPDILYMFMGTLALIASIVFFLTSKPLGAVGFALTAFGSFFGLLSSRQSCQHCRAIKTANAGHLCGIAGLAVTVFALMVA